MAKSRNAKSELLTKYNTLITEGSGFILVNLSGLDTSTITKLKMQLKEIGSNFTVVKNTILKIALTNNGTNVAIQDFDGSSALITVGEDPSVAAKLLKEVQTKTKMLDAKIGIFQGEVLTAERVTELAELPSREVLLSKLLGSLVAPLSGFMNATTGNARGFVMVLKGLSEKK